MILSILTVTVAMKQNTDDNCISVIQIWCLCSVHSRLGQRQQAPVADDGSSRLFAAAIRPQDKPPLAKTDARLKLSCQNTTGKMLDARQKLLQKTKYADARERIEKKKVEVHSEAASDMRTKILAKRRLGPNTDGLGTAVATAGKPQTTAGLQLSKPTPMLVTVSNQRRIASTASTGNKTVTTNSSFTSSRLVSFYTCCKTSSFSFC